MLVVYVQKSLLAFAALGYAILLVRLLQTTGFLRVKFLTLYVAAMVPAAVMWNPSDVRNTVLVGAILIMLRICVVIEVFLIVAPELKLAERRGMVLTVTGIAGLMIMLCVGYYDQPGLMGWYKSIRQWAHVGLATMLVFGALGCLCIRRPRLERWQRNHALITILYFLLFASVSFVRPGKGQLYLWSLADALFQAGVCLCVALWLRFVVPPRSRFPAFLQFRNPVI